MEIMREREREMDGVCRHFDEKFYKEVQLGSFSFSWICPVNMEGGTMSGKQEEEERMIDWKLHKVLHRMKSSVSTKWINDIRPALSLVFAASAAATAGASSANAATAPAGCGGHEDDDSLYHLVVKYEAGRLGLSDKGDGLKQMVHLKWIFMLDRLAEGSGPLPFPVTCCQLWKDPQWLPRRWPQRQPRDLMPPWKIPLTEFSLDDIPSDELALKN